MKLYVRISSQEQSIKVQETLFDLGYSWAGVKSPDHTTTPLIAVSSHREHLSYGRSFDVNVHASLDYGQSLLCVTDSVFLHKPTVFISLMKNEPYTIKRQYNSEEQ